MQYVVTCVVCCNLHVACYLLVYRFRMLYVVSHVPVCGMLRVALYVACCVFPDANVVLESITVRSFCVVVRAYVVVCTRHEWW